MKTANLYMQEGTSDKVYNVTLEPKGKKYVVNFEYGRRGSALKTGTKTDSPVSLEEAEKIFTKLVQEKVNKGYLEKDNEDEEETTGSGSVTIVKTVVDEESFSELDFELQAEFGFEYGDDDENEFNIIDENAVDPDEAHPLPIDQLIDVLQRFKSKGATHIQMEHHVDHIGYDIAGFRIEKASESLLNKRKEKEEKKKVKNEKISKLQSEIRKLELEED